MTWSRVRPWFEQLPDRRSDPGSRGRSPPTRTRSGCAGRCRTGRRCCAPASSRRRRPGSGASLRRLAICAAAGCGASSTSAARAERQPQRDARRARADRAAAPAVAVAPAVSRSSTLSGTSTMPVADRQQHEPEPDPVDHRVDDELQRRRALGQVVVAERDVEVLGRRALDRDLGGRLALVVVEEPLRRAAGDRSPCRPTSAVSSPVTISFCRSSSCASLSKRTV